MLPFLCQYQKNNNLGVLFNVVKSMTFLGYVCHAMMITFERFRLELADRVLCAINTGVAVGAATMKDDTCCPLGVQTINKWPGPSEASRAWNISSAAANAFMNGYSGFPTPNNDYTEQNKFWRLGIEYRKRFQKRGIRKDV